MTYFGWLNEEEDSSTAAVSGDAVGAILSGVSIDSANPPKLTITMLYEAYADLDLYFSCANGDEVGYGAANSCGQVDIDNVASHY
jgi:hypothetical protein